MGNKYSNITNKNDYILDNEFMVKLYDYNSIFNYKFDDYLKLYYDDKYLYFTNNIDEYKIELVDIVSWTSNDFDTKVLFNVLNESGYKTIPFTVTFEDRNDMNMFLKQLHLHLYSIAYKLKKISRKEYELKTDKIITEFLTPS